MVPRLLLSFLIGVSCIPGAAFAGTEAGGDRVPLTLVFSDDFEFGDLVGWDDEPAALAGITAAHNAVRDGVGVGMPPLVWDGHLAATAQAWAEGCVDLAVPIGLLDHNPDRSVGYPWYVGENIAGSSGPISAATAVDIWAAEAAYYDYATNTCAVGHQCGRYLQLVWAATQRVGCGSFFCSGLAFGWAVVCNYGPGSSGVGLPY